MQGPRLHLQQHGTHKKCILFRIYTFFTTFTGTRGMGEEEGHAHYTVHMLRSKDNLWELVFSLHHAVPGDPPQLIRVSHKHLQPVSHLVAWCLLTSRNRDKTVFPHTTTSHISCSGNLKCWGGGFPEQPGTRASSGLVSGLDALGK